MNRTDRTTWRHWIDAWLSGMPRGSAEAFAAEDGPAAWALELDRDREEAIRPLSPSRVLDLAAAAGAARPAALAG